MTGALSARRSRDEAASVTHRVSAPCRASAYITEIIEGTALTRRLHLLTVNHNHNTMGPEQCQVLLAVAALSMLYRCALPKPLPGIPYDVPSSKRLLGDIPDATKESAQIQKFLNLRSKSLGPVCQVWMQPFAKSWVVVNDWAASQDILYKHTGEFDRAPIHLGFLTALIPHGFGLMRTRDPRYAVGKRYVGDTMSNSFLNDVAAPSASIQVLKLIRLWRLMMRLSQGRSVDARQDVQLFSVDLA